ncbi:hypothetical protein, partial [Mesorhizobium japonicum]|uniref:hypothetical protein n=1 Tax=Mesorhizobium japonicum TaxID=2066070 RepID=UPI003B58F534
LLLRAQSTAWAGWIAALSLMRLTGGQHIDRSLPAAFRIGLPVIAVLVVALLVAFVLQALGRLENRAAGLWRLLLRDDRLALVNAALSVGAVIPLVVAAIVPEQLLPAMLVGGALLGAAAIVGYVRRTALGRSRPSNLVDS